MVWTCVPIIQPITPECSLFHQSCFFNQKPDDLSAGGFFYTGEVLYKQPPVYYENKYFLEEPTNIKLFLLQEKTTTQSVSIAVLL
jgi:hypothetical protein